MCCPLSAFLTVQLYGPLVRASFSFGLPVPQCPFLEPCRHSGLLWLQALAPAAQFTLRLIFPNQPFTCVPTSCLPPAPAGSPPAPVRSVHSYFPASATRAVQSYQISLFTCQQALHLSSLVTNIVLPTALQTPGPSQTTALVAHQPATCTFLFNNPSCLLCLVSLTKTGIGTSSDLRSGVAKRKPNMPHAVTDPRA